MDTKRQEKETFSRFAESTDQFEAYSHPHAMRIATLADEMAIAFSMARSDRQSLRHAALMHDLGEAAMKRDYIKRSTALNYDERLDMMRHPVIGEQEAARGGADRGSQLLVRWHHEWWNGGGYPDALCREQIPLGARILRVADTYAALTDARPFRPARSVDEARSHLTELAGLEFDPRVVRALLALSSIPELDSFAEIDKPAEEHYEADDMIRELVEELGE